MLNVQKTLNEIRELEIIKAALETDIIQQKQCVNAEFPAYKEWLNDSEKVLKKVSNKIFDLKSKLLIQQEENKQKIKGVE